MDFIDKHKDHVGQITGNPASREIKQVVYSRGKRREAVGNIIVELPVLLTVNGDPWLTFMCTPVDLTELMVGFLFNEEIIAHKSDIACVRVCSQGDNVDIWLTHSVEKPKQWTRTSGCSGGITGLEIHKHGYEYLHNGGVLTTGQINRLIINFYQTQTLYQKTGGVHTSALSDGLKILISAEDIGRHNTLDKLSGHYLLREASPSRNILLTTGRISSEMLQKAARLRAPIVISRTSSSSRSIEMAERLGITLIGYARRDQFLIYTYPERIID